MIIKNFKELTSKGNVEGRRVALDIIDNALRAIDSYNVTKKLIQLSGNLLRVGSINYDLSKVGNIYVVGGGKSVIRIAEALEDILDDWIKTGVIVEKKGQGHLLKRIKVLEGSHPIPDKVGMRGAEEVVRIGKEAGKSDIVFVCVTGGCSALLPLPVERLSLEDKMIVTDLLLKCGAEIQEINSVRKHLSAIKGGRLARYIHPAEVVSLIVVDEVAGLPWGPSVPDNMRTTFEEADSVLKRYGLWEKIPNNVRTHLEKADPNMETLKTKDFEKLGIKSHIFILAHNETVCEAAKRRAEELGYNSLILSTMIEGESRETGIALAGIAKEVEKNDRPLNPPCVLVSGGETTVTIEGEFGEGGRNQELALGSALKIDGNKNIVIASIGTDGTDGPTDIAGGIVDGYTLKIAREKGIKVFENLRSHNSAYVLRKLGDAIYTGVTGTNVMDLRLIVVTK